MRMPVGEIRKELLEAGDMQRELLLDRFRDDDRAGVRALVAKYDRERERLSAELARLDQMQEYERRYGEYSLICGIDEVGRGPLAGPVMAAAVILPKEAGILYINDSKKLSAKKRKQLDREIREKAVALGIGMASAEVIDRVNILNATYEAMRQAIGRLAPMPELLLIDAVRIPGLSIKQVSIIKGDAKSVSIAAASIVAKVARDELMVQYDARYPEYHFADNKGYGSERHIEALQRFGPCPIHRTSFIKNFRS